jgi:hypothetical protein
MRPSNQSFPQFPPPNLVGRDHEFEWLLCLAATFKTCQFQPPTAFEAAQKPLQSKGTGGDGDQIVQPPPL